MRAEFITGIDRIEPTDWNALNQSDSPFLRHEFLFALEHSQSVCADSGWQPCHVVIKGDHDELLAAMPVYIKSHSYGEYVFDWAWANAYHRAGREYYPKLLTAVPFSPVGGARLLHSPSLQDPQSAIALAFQQQQTLAKQIKASSWHVLFPERQQAEQFTAAGLLHRIDCQYHWFNDGFDDFERFLSSFASRKRKNVRKERKRVAEQGITLTHVEGPDISAEQWEDFYQFYHMTYYKRGGSGYLNQAFFDLIADSMPEQLVMVIAERDGQAVGAALCFKDETTLYGRYWGCVEEFEHLHFEACYYQGIDYCIRQGLQRFDPGAQGQHKIARGFIPIFTHSCHWLAEEDFSQAIEQFLGQETPHIEAYRVDACDALPFNQEFLVNSELSRLIESGVYA